MRVAAVGHVEWTEFAEVAHVPRPGEIVETRGALGPSRRAAARWPPCSSRGWPAASGRSSPSLGDDELGHTRQARASSELGADRARRAGAPTSRRGARSPTSTTTASARSPSIGERLEPRGDDPLPWDELARRRRRATSPRATPPRCAPRARARALVGHRARRAVLAGGARRSSTRSSGRAPTRASATSTARSTRRRSSSCARRARAGGEWVGGEGRTRQAGRPPQLPGPRARRVRRAATPSPAGSRTGSATVATIDGRARARPRAAARTASPAAARTSGSCAEADDVAALALANCAIRVRNG